MLAGITLSGAVAYGLLGRRDESPGRKPDEKPAESGDA
jgi:hypothetical protein